MTACGPNHHNACDCREAMFSEMAIKLEQVERELSDANEQLDRLRRGEFICQRCSLRKDGETPLADF